MKLTERVVALAAAVVACIFGSTTMADSLWQTIELEGDNPPFYLDCLGENVIEHYWVTIVSREFESPSGNSHYIEHWTYDSLWTGEDTGHKWLSQGQSPGSFQVMKGEVGQWTSRARAIPVEEDEPSFRFNTRFKYTVDANGDLRVSYLPPADLNDIFRCLGPDR